MSKQMLEPLRGLSRLELPEEISKRVAVYNEAHNLLAQEDSKNIYERIKNNQMIENRYDNYASYTFIGALGSILVGGLYLWLDGSGAFFWSILFGLNIGATAILHRMAHRAHKKEMALVKQDAAEEIEDKLNNYAFLLDGAVEYINAQIELWNLRVNYLNECLAEPTPLDYKRHLELREVRNDFYKRIQRLQHLYKFKEAEKVLMARGIDVTRLQGRLQEYLTDLKPIVPEISTDPLMLEAIKEMEEAIDGTNEDESEKK